VGTQFLPSDDTFEHGADVYGTNVAMYISTRLTASSSPVKWGQRNLHSGYQTVASDGVFDTPAALIGGSDSVADQMQPGGMIYRAIASIADVVVTARFRQFVTQGNPGLVLMAVKGVMSRVQAGSLATDDSLTVSYNAPSCYIAYYKGNFGSAVVDFVIARVNTGTFTTLTSTTRASSLFDSAALGQAMTVSLTATNSGADVGLTATFAGMGQAATITLTHNDTGGSVLQGVGRCGFSAGRDRRNSSDVSRVTDLIEEFTILSGSSVLLDDRFDRYQIGGAYDFSADANYTDINGNAGNSLQMAYYWDQFTANGARMERDAAAERAKISLIAGDSSFIAATMASRKATNTRSQHRSAVFEIEEQPGAGQVGLGIMLRGSQPVPTVSDLDAANGYVAYAVWSSGGTTTPSWIVSRWKNGRETQIAEFEDTGATNWTGYGTTYTMDFEIYNREGSTSDGPTTLILKIDGTQVSLADVGSIGIKVDAAGTVVDSTGARVKTGDGEGVYFFNTAGATLSLYADSWAEGSLTNAELADRDQASIVVSGEGTLTGVDLVTILPPDYPLSIRVQHQSLKFPFESGHRTTNPKFTNSSNVGISRRTYGFSRAGVTTAQLSVFVTYWNAHEGSELAFPFTPPGGTQRSVHFVEDSMTYRLDKFGSYSLQFSMEEIL